MVIISKRMSAEDNNALVELLRSYSDSQLTTIVNDKETYSALARRIAAQNLKDRDRYRKGPSPAALRARMMGQVKFYSTGMIGSIKSLKEMLKGIEKTDADMQNAVTLIVCLALASKSLQESVTLSENINAKAMAARALKKAAAKAKKTEAKEIETAIRGTL